MTDRIRTYREFWPHYVGEHRVPMCRALHYVGTFAGVSLAGFGVATAAPLWIVLGLVCGYGPAWVGHFFVEGNRPATFRYPLWSFVSDFRMLGLAVTGRMGREVTRLYGSTSPASDAPLRIDVGS